MKKLCLILVTLVTFTVQGFPEAKTQLKAKVTNASMVDAGVTATELETYMKEQIIQYMNRKKMQKGYIVVESTAVVVGEE